MKKILHLVLSLTIISAVCAATLAIIDNITKGPIKVADIIKAKNAAMAVLPKGLTIEECPKPDPNPTDTSVTNIVCHVGYADANKKTVVGYAVPGVSDNGYGGKIRLMVGLSADRKVFSYRVLAASETPGLGAKLGDADFSGQFKDKSSTTLKVKKDGGEIEAITGATITSRAVCDAIADACARMERLKAAAVAAPAASQPADSQP